MLLLQKKNCMGAIFKACSITENITKLTEKSNLILQTCFMGQFCNIPQRQLTQAFRNSRTLDQQYWTRPPVCGWQLCSLESLRGTWQWDQDIPLVLSWLFRAYYLWWDALLSLMPWRGTWYWFHLMCQTLLTSHGKNFPCWITTERSKRR